MKILIAVDGSEYTRKMLAWWAAHDDFLGPDHRYTVFTVVPQIPAYAASAVNRELLLSYYSDEGEKIFKPIRAFLDQQKHRVTFLSKAGTVADAIAHMAQSENFDLVVMGSHGHGAVANLVMGSTATRVLASCKTPVLLIR
ncbi:MAG: universal stress protein [Burkholderiales bacterium]|nr:universal stress protein [Burkholderiales bacterium]